MTESAQSTIVDLHHGSTSEIAIETLSLEQLQAELRIISGTPSRSNDDAAYRRDLWRRLDRLVCERAYVGLNQ